MYTREQARAIRSRSPRVVVRACPGAGKTAVLTERLARLIGEVDPSSIAAVTFTRNAAEEMQARLVAKAGLKAEGARVGTLHSLCLETVRRLSGRQPEIADEQRQKLAVKAAADIHGLPEREAAAAITAAKAKGDTTSPLLSTYQEALDGARDFDDILLEALAQLERKGGESLPWRHFLVDEAQDLNPVQARILGRLIALPGATFFAVGDPDQAIYGFRGADPALFEVLPGERVEMDVNWRSGEVIVSSASRLASAPYRAGRDLRGRIEWFEAEDLDREIEVLIQKVKEEPSPCDVAVLARTNLEATILAASLQAEGVPVLGRDDILELDKLRDLAALLRVVASPGKAATETFLRAAGVYCKYLWSREFREAMRYKTRKAMAWEASKGRMPKPWMERRLAGFRKFVGRAAGMAREHSPQVVLREAAAYLARQEWSGFPEMDEDLLSAILRVAGRKKTLKGAAKALEEAARTRENGVRVLTAHAAKGLEAPTVFVPFLNRGSYPHGKAEDVEEERRLLFVALTRARDRLAVSWVRGEGSPFLKVLGLPPRRKEKRRVLWFFSRTVEKEEPQGGEGQELTYLLEQRKAA